MGTISTYVWLHGLSSWPLHYKCTEPKWPGSGSELCLEYCTYSKFSKFLLHEHLSCELSWVYCRWLTLSDLGTNPTYEQSPRTGLSHKSGADCSYKERSQKWPWRQQISCPFSMEEILCVPKSSGLGCYSLYFLIVWLPQMLVSFWFSFSSSVKWAE